MSSARRDDIVAIESRDLGILARVYPHLTALDQFVVTRIDAGRGRKALYLRKVGRTDQVVVAWPEQVRIIKRHVPDGPKRRAVGGRGGRT